MGDQTTTKTCATGRTKHFQECADYTCRHVPKCRGSAQIIVPQSPQSKHRFLSWKTYPGGKPWAPCGVTCFTVPKTHEIVNIEVRSNFKAAVTRQPWTYDRRAPNLCQHYMCWKPSTLPSGQWPRTIIYDASCSTIGQLSTPQQNTTHRLHVTKCARREGIVRENCSHT